MLRFFRVLPRLIQIARALARHDLIAPLKDLGVGPFWIWLGQRLGPRPKPGQGRVGERLAQALTVLGPTFVKFGQTLSTRADLIGDVMALDLSALQDRLPPFAGEEAVTAIEAELQKPLGEIFASFDLAPVSAASIAQVHFATLKEGDEVKKVAVKVLRPAIEAAIERDIRFLEDLAHLGAALYPRLRRLQPVLVIALFAQTVRLEMDLRMEASAADELANNFRDDPNYKVPAIDWDRSGRRVLTLERVDGVSMDDIAGLAAKGHSARDILEKAATIFFQQVFRDGFFHGDQHPGNLWVDETGRIVALDFGIMGRLSLATRHFLADVLTATLTQDYRRLAKVHVEAGMVPRETPVDLFAQALRSVCAPVFGKPLNDISFARLLGQLFRLTESFAMPVQPQLLLLQKNMLMAEGISRQLDPALNIWLLAEPLIRDWTINHRGPEARVREVAADARRRIEDLPKFLSNLERAAAMLAEGKLVIALEDPSPRKNGALAWSLGLAGAALLVALVALIA